MTDRSTPALALALALAACNNAGFSGSGTTPQPAHPAAVPVASSEPPSDELGDEQAGKDTDGDEPTTPVKEEPVTGSQKPKNNPTVVTDGPFTAWAVPSRPVASQDYLVYVEITLPPATANYTLADTSGDLTGSDGYRQTIGEISKFYPTRDSEGFDTLPPEIVVNGRIARLTFKVPGARQPSVTDTVKITSKLLGKSASLRVVFK
jgi:hypothetical protein